MSKKIAKFSGLTLANEEIWKNLPDKLSRVKKLRKFREI